jgi:hypothetical protein
MTAEERAESVLVQVFGDDADMLVCDELRPVIAAAVRAAVEGEREACARLAGVPPYYADPRAATREVEVRAQIAAAIRARGDACTTKS